MRNAFFLALTFFWTSLGLAQVGNGIVFMVDNNYAFPGTTVDSLSTLDISVHNQVGVAQTVFFGALSAPFSLVDNSPLEIPANDSATVTLQFQPESLGLFNGTLEAVGGVFGSASFDFSGTGIQVVLEWTPESLVFDTTAIGQTSKLDVVFTNTGNGTAELEAFDDPSGLFYVDFISTYEPPTSEVCLEHSNTIYHTFFLTVDLGTDPGSTYWQIEDAYGFQYYGGAYDNPVDSFAVCLPVSDSPSPTEFYLHFVDYSGNPDGTIEIEDAFGNVMFSQSLSPSASEYSSWQFINVGNPPAPPAFTPGVIEEGQSQTARVVFAPQDAGQASGNVTFQTNDPSASNIVIACHGTGISEVSGEVCDSHWTVANSPFTFVGDVVVPEGCTLQIDPGVEIIQNGATLVVNGDLIADGSEANPIQLSGGGLDFGPGELNSLSHVNRISEDSEIDVIYFNSFESQERAWEFDCYDYAQNQYWTGTSDNGNYGCEDFYWHGGCSSQLDNDNYSLRFRTDASYDGYLYLADTVYAPQSGTYEISFQVGCVDLQNDSRFQLQLETSTGWEVVDEVLPQMYGSPFILSHKRFYEEGAAVNFRLYMANEGSNNYVYIDDVRIGRVFNESSKGLWDFSTYADSVNATTGDYYDDVVFIEEDTLVIKGQYGYPTWNTLDFPESPIDVVSTGWHYIKFWHKLDLQERQTAISLQISWNGGSNWTTIADHQQYTGGDYGQPHDWTEIMVAIPYEFEDIGTRIDFRIEFGFNSGSDEYNEIDWSIYGVQIFQRDFLDASLRDLVLDNVTNTGLKVNYGSLTATNSDLQNVDVNNGDLDASSTAFQSIRMFNGDLSLHECTVSGSESPRRGIELTGDSAHADIFGSTISNNWGGGIYMQDPHSHLELSHSFVMNNSGSGVWQYQGDYNSFQEGTYASIRNSLIGYNSGYGVFVDGDADIDYSNIIENGSTGLRSTTGFTTIDNSIVWFNGESPQIQAYSNASGNFALSYSNVQGINALLTDDQYAWGEGCIGTDPLLIDEMGNIDANSPCVDGGMPWEEDAHIPMGQGSSRADMGMYGGPDNAYWGGVPPPDGSVVITDVFDIPNDQGNQLGIQFSASPFDFGGLGFNVTHYSVWRDLAVDSEGVVDVADGNWEQIGTVPAQGFNQYGYTAETLVNTTPDDPACMTNFIVVAHTTVDNIYWVSDVAGACAVDNLAPSDPEINGVVVEEENELAILVHWLAPEEEDYAYTVVINDAGFEAQLNNDTLIVDDAVEFETTYTYTVTHFDVNGNASNPASITLEASGGVDEIPLVPGWNLISSDRIPVDADIEAILLTAQQGNIEYVTGFNAGVQFYDPDGLSFLNTLDSWTNGYGYWVKAIQTDTLEIAGASLAANYLPALNAGWNLIGFPNALPAAPADYFASFISAGTLEYVTGFDGGSTYFDPNGLPFLNSLTALENSFGYWVKVTEAYDPNGMVLVADEPLAALSGASSAQPNPNFMLVNGTSDLTDAAGEYVDVVAAGRVVSRLPVLEGGYLMTTALFGDDPATPAIEGLEIGTLLEFQFRGALANQTIEYTGQMDLRQLALTFGVSASSVAVFPNPFADVIQISGEADATGMLSIQLTDAQGRMVAERAATLVAAGAWNVNWSVPTLAPGLYTCTVTMDGKRMTAIPLMHVN